MLIKNANKIVLKLGSTTVVDSNGVFKKKWVTSLIKDIKKYGKGKHFVIVSSGAIALGQKYLNSNRCSQRGWDCWSARSRLRCSPGSLPMCVAQSG